MISGVTLEAAGRTWTLRLTTRAMMALEDRYDMGVAELAQQMNDRPRMGTLVHFLAECLADGAGCDVAEAQQLADAVGFTRVGEVLSRVMERAFPEADGAPAQAAGKNPGGAARSG